MKKQKQQTVTEQIYNIISDTVFIDTNTISNEKSFMMDLNLDPLDCLNIIIKCENTFNINITDYEIESIITVNDLIKIVENKNPTILTQKQNRIKNFLNKFKRNKQIVSNATAVQHTK